MKRSNYRRKLEWWLDNENHRNHFCISTVHSRDLADLTEMVRSGLMMQGRTINDGSAVYFHVTDEGIKLAKKEFPKHDHS
jgi:L,D-peptidoglycan transpeptidase YkuD (ErfK/YbiS/YcfS/YnhG family)